MLNWYTVGLLWFLISIPMVRQNSAPKEKRSSFSEQRSKPKKSDRDVQTVKRPKKTGSSEIDNFVNAAFDLNDEIISLKNKLKDVSDGLAEANEVLTAIDKHPEGPIGWAKLHIAKGGSKSANAMKNPIGSSADDLNPLAYLRNELGTLKSGISGGAIELKSVPNDIKVIGDQGKSLLSSALELPKAAKSLGMKAPKALKAIRSASDVLKNIPNEAQSIGDEAKKVSEEIDNALKNIQSILSTA